LQDAQEATSSALAKGVNITDVIKLGTSVYIAPKEGEGSTRLGDLAILGGSRKRPLMTVLKDPKGNSVL